MQGKQPSGEGSAHLTQLWGEGCSPGCKRAWLGALTRLRHNGVDLGPIERRNWLQPLVCSRGCWVIVFFRDSWSASRGGSAGMLGFCWGYGEAIR